MCKKIGLIAPEFPPLIGGIEQLALGMAHVLSTKHDVTVFTAKNCGVQTNIFAQKPVLQKEIRTDAETLKNECVDLWLALNAGYAPLARKLNAPFFIYCHGNDFFTPWIVDRGSLDRRIWQCERWLSRIPYFWRYKGRLSAPFERVRIKNGLQAARHLFANSRYTSNNIQELFMLKSKDITVINPGVSDWFFQNIERSSDHTLRILTITRLSKYAPKKNIESVLQALTNLPGDLRFRYTIIGDGHNRDRLEKLCEDLGLTTKVRFAGYVANDKIPLFLKNTDLFVLTPNGMESFGIVYAEMSASGVPVIGSAESGATDAIADGVNGILIPRSTPAEIAKGIIRFWRERDRFPPEQVREFGEQFRWSVVGKKLETEIMSRLD